MKTLTILATLLLGQVLAAATCADLFTTFHEPLINLYYQPTIAEAKRESLNRWKLENAQFNRLRLAAKMLRERGTEFEIVPGNKINPKLIRILPGDTTQLNQLAKVLEKKYSIELIADPTLWPKGIKGQLAKYLDGDPRLYLSIEAVATGRPDANTLHEIKHGALYVKAVRNHTVNIVNGWIRKSPTSKWPWSKTQWRTYANYMSLEESLTWLQGAEYYFRTSLGQGTNWRISKSNELDDAMDIVSRVSAFVDFEIASAKKDQVIIEFDRVNQALTLKMNTDSFESFQVVPESFWRDRGAVLSSDSPEAEKQGREAVDAYLEKLSDRLNMAKARLEKYRAFESEMAELRLRLARNYLKNTQMQSSWRQLLPKSIGNYLEQRDEDRFIEDLKNYPDELISQLEREARDLKQRLGLN